MFCDAVLAPPSGLCVPMARGCQPEKRACDAVEVEVEANRLKTTIIAIIRWYSPYPPHFKITWLWPLYIEHFEARSHTLSWGRRALCDCCSLWQILASPNLYKQASLQQLCAVRTAPARRRCPAAAAAAALRAWMRPLLGAADPRWSPKSLASCYQLTLLKG